MKKIIITITLVCLAVVLALEPISLAWMSDNGMSSPVGITSNVHKSYFESGDGTAGSPLEIARPIQLYYFAWLQYLGYFNRDNDGDGKIDTYYFYISDKYCKESQEFNMDGYFLPPIGTQTNPFLGNLDGKGITIKNLTVQNQSGLTEPPSNVSSLTGVEIVGFMGVVGKITGDYTYDTQANEVKNLVLENLTVKTQTENALIGLAAGYVNGTVSGVGVANSKVDIQSSGKLGYTSNYSDYSLIGYCTEGCKNSVNVMDVLLTTPDVTDVYDVIPPSSGTGGNTSGWGASVAMQTIHGLLSNVQTTSNSNYVTERVDLIRSDGKLVTVDSTPVSRNNAKQTATIPDFGSFVFTSMNHAGGVNFVGGSQGVTELKYVETTVTSPITLYYITDGTNYLCFNGTGITSTTTSSNATQWYVSNGTSGGLIYTVTDDGMVYYLTMENNNLTVAWKVNPNSLTQWSVSSSELRYGTNYNYRKIRCTNGTWESVSSSTTTSVTSYRISAGSNNYLSVNNNKNGVTNVTNQNDATLWTITTSGSNTTISTVIDETTYYLGRKDDNSLTLIAGSTASTNINWSYNTENSRFSINDYFLSYNNGWALRNSDYGTRNLTLRAVETTIKTNVKSAGTTNKKIECSKREYIDNSLENFTYGEDGGKLYTGTDHAGLTYFPLSFKDGYKVSDTNTGYIIGSEWDSTTNTDSQDGYDSNLRISAYDIDDLGSKDAPYVISHATVELSTLPTLPSGADGFTEAELEEIAGYGVFKYAAAYSTYYGSVSGRYSYGLHFMNAPVSETNTARITANLQSVKTDNYEVPTNCIDFNLYEKGFINAVAGTYYSQGGKTNNSFFSIYQIFRSGTEITGIKEISKIYGKLTPSGKIDRSKDYEYYYVYVNEADNHPENFKLIFDCAWLTDTATKFNNKGWSTNRAYYFEVPVNAGEYAIGSTAGKTGAYLVYLDLAANAQLTERSKEYEVITETQGVAYFPKGVELFDANNIADNIVKDENDNVSVIVNPANSAFAAISNATGEIAFTKSDTNNTVTVTRDPEKGNINAAYIGSGSLLDGSTPLVVQAGNLIVQNKVIQRTTYRDYNTISEVTTVTVITKTTVGTANPKYQKDVTTYISDADGNLTQTSFNSTTSDSELLPDTPDPDDLASKNQTEKGADLVSLSFSYTSTGVSLSYSYNSGTNQYDVTITSDTALTVTATMLDTSDAAATVFINGTRLAKNTNPQTVRVEKTTSGT